MQVVIGSGQTSTLAVSSGETLLVSAGGTALQTQIGDGGSAVILAGGVASDSLLTGTEFNGGTQIISSGGIAIATTLNSGGEFVDSGGTSDLAQVNFGSEVVSAGGEASGTVVFGAGSALVASGGSALAISLSGGALLVNAGGVVSGLSDLDGTTSVFGTAIEVALTTELQSAIAQAVVESGGLVDDMVLNPLTTGTILAGGTASGGTVSFGALMADLGLAAGVTVQSGGFLAAVSGGVASAAVAQALGVINASAGGSAVADQIDRGGELLLSSGGIGLSNTISSGGFGLVSSGGVASGTDVESGGTLVLLAGGVQTGTTLAPGGTVVIDANVLATETPFSAGLPGNQPVLDFAGSGLVSGLDLGDSVITLLAGGTTVSASVDGGGGVSVSSGGVASDTSASGSGTFIAVSSGGVADGTALDIFADESVLSGGSASGAVVQQSTLAVAFGGTAVATTIEAFGVLFDEGTLVGDRVGAQAQEIVLGVSAVGGVSTPAVASSSIVASGGSEMVSSGGSTFDTTIEGGGLVLVSSAGFTSGMQIAAGGFAIVSSGGLASGTVVASGAELVVLAGGAASGSTVEAGGTVVLDPNVLLTSNQLVVSAASGIVSGLLVGSGQVGTVLAGGSAVSASVLSGGELAVTSGGLAVAAQVSSGGKQVVSSGGLTQGTVVSSGGSQSVLGSGDAVGTILLGGLAQVQNGGTATDFQVEADGEAGVFGTGVMLATSVGAGGTLANAGGVISGAVISSWGTLIGAGGTDITLDTLGSALLDGPTSGLTIASGARVLAGGALAGSVVDDGVLTVAPEPLVGFSGTLTGSGSFRVAGSLVLGGADAFAGGVTLDTNTVLELTSGAAAGTGGLTFTGGDLLRISGTTMPVAPIAGFDTTDVIDLTALPFAAGGSAGIVGSSLVVSVGGTADTLALAGMLSLPAGGITLFADGAGGTLVTLGARPLISGLPVLSVGSGSSVSNVLVLSGGSLDVLAGGTASDVALYTGASATVAGVELGAVVDAGAVLGISGAVTVLAGGVDSGAVISRGTLGVQAGGFVAGDTVLATGDITIASGASASGLTVGGGFENDGTLIGATVINGGRLGNEAVASNVVVGSGGIDGNDGTQFSAVVSSGGTLLDFGVISGATIENGGTFELSLAGGMFGIQDDGGTVELDGGALDGTIAGGGVLDSTGGTIDPGASFAGTVEVSANKQLLFAGAAPGVTGPIVLDQFANLAISGSTMPENVISGFGQDNLIDLQSLPFASGGSATIVGGNTLSVVEGGVSADLLLDPSRSYAGVTPMLASNGGSGTEITLGQTLDLAALVGSAVTVSAGTVLSDTLVYEPNNTGAVPPLTVAAGGTLVNAGIQAGVVEDFGVAISTLVGDDALTVLEVNNGGTAIDLTLEGADANGGLPTAVVHSGGVVVAPTIDGGVLDLQSGASLSGTAVTFTSAGGILGGTAAVLQGVTIDGFSPNATIDLHGLASLLDASVTLAGADNTLDIGLDGQTTDIVLGSPVSPQATFGLALTGTVDPLTQIQVSSDTLLTMTVPPCFAAGTRIATPEGERRVEELRQGDLVLTASGQQRSILWLGHRRVDCRRYPKPRDVWPVQVRAGAFGERKPCRDLWLSPDHAVFVVGVLIPVRYLINGRTIAQEERDAVSYWHVELARHDVILANGLPCESYLDTGNRCAFADGGAAVQMHPDFALRIWDAEACAPLVRGGPRLFAAKRRLLARATSLGHATTDDPRLRIMVDGREVTADVTERRLWRVRLPQTAERVRLQSRVWVPGQMRAGEDDARALGIAISRIWLDRREVSPESPGLAAGWHAPEPGWRWTDGDGELLLSGVRELAFEVAMTGTYWQSEFRVLPASKSLKMLGIP
jgi:autotransporter passenger strand-loop-strand repeat protein